MAEVYPRCGFYKNTYYLRPESTKLRYRCFLPEDEVFVQICLHQWWIESIILNFFALSVAAMVMPGFSF